MTDPTLLATLFACAIRGWTAPPAGCTAPAPVPPVSVPALTDAEALQADMTAGRVVAWWAPAVGDTLAARPREGVTADLVLAVIAQESAGYPGVVSNDGHGSVGLMQPLPRWAPPGADLADPGTNILVGTGVLEAALRTAGGDVRTGLAYYNCGERGVHAGACGEHGGYAYADRVLGVWLLRVREELGWSYSGTQSSYVYS